MGSPANTASLHVLLVEDHAKLRRALASALDSRGYCVSTAGSGDEALQQLATGTSADILVSDIRMAGSTDGLALAQWVRANRPGMAVLLITGYTDLATGPFHMLLKPFSPDQLIAKIGEVLRTDARSGAA